MADNVQLQGIEFQIVGESEKAVGGVKSLTSSLRKLQNLSGKGLGLSKIAQEIKDFNSAFGDNKNWGLLNMASAVSDIAKSSRSIMTVRGHLQAISDLDFSNLTTAAQAIGAISDAAGWRRGGSGGGRNGGGNTIPTDLPTGEPDTEPVTGSTQKMEEVAKAEDKAITSGKVLRQVLVNLAKEFKTGAVKAFNFGKKLLALPFKKLAASIKNTLAPLKQFLHSIARIAMYRAIRGLLSGITSALKEGMKNLYQYSKIAGTTFHSAMDMAATDALWLKNSLAAAVAPIVEALMPALDALAAKIVTVLNLLSQLMAILGGKSTYTRAVKSAKEYGEAAGGAAKEVRMLISGFDELNAFQDKSGGGGGADYGSMFEEADVDSGLGDFAKQLKEAFENGDWEELGRLLGEKVNEIFAAIDWEGIGSKLGKKIDGVIRTAYSFLKTVDFKAIGGDIAKLINGAIREINFETAGRLFIRKITALFDLIIGFIKTLSWDDVAKAIGDFFMGAFREASEWLHNNDFAEIGRIVSDGIKKILDAMLRAVREMDWFAVGKAIGDFLGNIDWAGILWRVAEIVWTAFKGVLEGLLSTSGGRMFLALFAAIKGLKLAFTLTEGLFSAAVQRWVLTGISPLQTMPTLISQITTPLSTALGNLVATLKTGLTNFTVCGKTLLTGAGAVFAQAALGVFDGIMIAYDYKALSEAAHTYNEAQQAHNHETETALNSYANLYRTKGKETADAWAEMVYQIDTTNMEFDQAQQALTQKIEGYWDGVPQNMWDGFKQGWNSYFGEGGSGLFGLLGDAFTGAVNGIKGLLGIHSPSTVFFDMGVDLVTGLFNGITSVWETVSGFFTQAFTGLKTTVQQTWTNIQQFTTQTWTNIQTTMVNLFTNARANIVSNLNTLKSNITSAWNSAKTATTSAWTSMTTTARAKFQEIKNTVTTSMNTATSFLRSIQWGSIGSNLVNGLLNGLKSAWSAVVSWVSSAASSLSNTLRNAFSIHSPSKEWAEIGSYLDLGLQEGLEGGTGNLLATATKIANAMTGAIMPTLPSPALVAAGMTPTGVNAMPINGGYEDYGEDDGSVSGIASMLEQMFEYMRTAGQDKGDVKVIIDGREVFNAVVNENNRAIQRTGASPIRV